MITFRKLAAAHGTGRVLREYLSSGTADALTRPPLTLSCTSVVPGPLVAYYSARSVPVAWRSDMPAGVARALGVDVTRPPQSAELDRLFEARRGDTGTPWSARFRTVCGYDFTAAPHKSVTLAAEFAADPTEAAAIREAVRHANDIAMALIADELGWARRGNGGRDDAHRGEVGWLSFVHETARPTLPIQDGRHGPTLPQEAAVPGDPHHHIHNVLFNLVVTASGHVGSLDTRRLTRGRVMLFGAVFQATLATELRRLGIKTAFDARGEAVVLPAIPERIVAAYSKGRDRTVRAAKAEAARQGMDWVSLSAERKIGFANAAAVANRLAKTDGRGDREAWRALAADLGWQHATVLGGGPRRELDREAWLRLAYQHSADALARDFLTEAVVDHDRIRLHAARALIGLGMSCVSDIDVIVAEVEARGIEVAGRPAGLLVAEQEGRLRVTHTRQLQVEEGLAAQARRAAEDYSGALPAGLLSAELEKASMSGGVEAAGDCARVAVAHALGGGAALSVLVGVAGAGKTTLLRPLVAAYRADRRLSSAGRDVIGAAVAWRQAEALRAAGIEKTYALTPLLAALDSGRLRPDRNTVVVIDEVSQVPPAAMLRLLEIQAATGMTVKALGDPEQCQAIEAGDTIEILRRVLPRSAMPELMTTIRQRRERERLIAGLFRAGRAEEALRLKREDGTARLVGGDYWQVVEEIADLYLRRRDVLAAGAKDGERRTVTVSALANEDANAISQAIRQRLRDRGEIARAEPTYRAVDRSGASFDLPIAAGDQLRLYQRTRGIYPDGSTGLVGSNGDIVRVEAVDDDGLRLRGRDGRVAAVAWWRLADPAGRGLLLGLGYCLTVDAAQGITATEHINALPHGSAGATAFKSYVAESRHVEATYTLIGEAGVREAEIAARPVGDGRPMGTDELWARVARDMSAKPRKTLAVDLIRGLRATLARGEVGRHRTDAQAKAAREWSERVSAVAGLLASRVAELDEDAGTARAVLGTVSAALDRTPRACGPSGMALRLSGPTGEAVSLTSPTSPFG
jgi:hypothetical protein